MNSKEPQDYDVSDDAIAGHRANISKNQYPFKNALIESTAASSTSELSLSDFHRNISLKDRPTVCSIEVLATGQYCYLSCRAIDPAWLGINAEDLAGKSPQEIFAFKDAEAITKIYDDCVRSRQVVAYEESVCQGNECSCWLVTLNPQFDAGGNVKQLISTSVKLDRSQEVAAAEVRSNRKQLLSAIAWRISQSLDLQTILQQTVEEVRSFLQTDRVAIYRFDRSWQGSMAVESVAAPWHSILDKNVHDPCFNVDLVDDYYQGKIQVIEDVRNANLSACYLKLLAECKAQANLVVPIVAEAKLWGLLIAQHCCQPRKWQQANIELLKQLTTKVGIAVQQAELHQQVQNLNTSLEAEVEQRTAQLRQALKSEELVRSITQAIRDSLDEKQVLHTATKSLAWELNIECCQIELYKRDRTTEVLYEYPIVLPDERGIHRQVSDYPELYQQLLERKSLQFVDWLPTVGYRQQRATRLICAIFDDRGILGNLWLMRPKEDRFEPWEVQLVQQIADQCAIAIRQARLYQAEQIQVKELEKLNLVKDDFLKTISHELRTPMSRIRLAISTLDNLLEAEIGAHQSPKIDKVMEIFHSSYKKQNQLVDDLLTLCYVDVASKPDVWESIELKTWIFQIVKSFAFSARQKQQLQLELSEALPPLYTDSKMLKRVIHELLNNAHKYTPSSGKIIIRTAETSKKLLIEVINTGIEISTQEQKRIFDKFYRIPNQDPWQYGGTGIGLALVKKLVELLEGEITVSSQEQVTIFTLAFDIN